MKVLMLGWELPPHNSGGLGVACFNLAKKLANDGADIDFIVPYTANYGIDFMNVTGVSEIVGQPINSYGSAGVQLMAPGETEYVKKVSEVIDQKEFDIIHAHDWLTFRAALLAKEKTGWPLIAHVHAIESDRAGGHGNPIIREVEQMTFLLADRIVAVSEHTKRKIAQEYHISPDKIEVVHNSIDLTDLEPIDAANSYFYLNFLKQSGYKIICNVGRQTLQKGLPNLLQAAKLVLEHEPKTVFLLIGDGEQRNELIDLAAELGISRNVLFAGFQRGKQVRDAFAVADLFVMPSVSEPFGLTPLESIGYGTPTLISKQSGVAEVIKNTLKVDFWDVDEMANQIVGVVRNHTLQNSLLINAQKELENLSWQQSADKFMHLYKKFSEAAV